MEMKVDKGGEQPPFTKLRRAHNTLCVCVCGCECECVCVGVSVCVCVCVCERVHVSYFNMKLGATFLHSILCFFPSPTSRTHHSLCQRGHPSQFFTAISRMVLLVEGGEPASPLLMKREVFSRGESWGRKKGGGRREEGRKEGERKERGEGERGGGREGEEEEREGGRMEDEREGGRKGERDGREERCIYNIQLYMQWRINQREERKRKGWSYVPTVTSSRVRRDSTRSTLRESGSWLNTVRHSPQILSSNLPSRDTWCYKQETCTCIFRNLGNRSRL